MACRGCQQRRAALALTATSLRHGDLRRAASSLLKGISPSPRERDMAGNAARNAVSALMKRIIR